MKARHISMIEEGLRRVCPVVWIMQLDSYRVPGQLGADGGIQTASCDVLRDGILCEVLSQKCSSAWQGAPGQRLRVFIMLPGRQLADDWLDYMLSQGTNGPCTTKGASAEPVTVKNLQKERRRLRAKHL